MTDQHPYKMVSSEHAERQPDHASRMEEPIFIIGASRSGTTMLRLILNAHPNIAIPDELKYFNSLPHTVDLRAWRTPAMSSESYDSWVKRYFHERQNVLKGVNVEDIIENIRCRATKDLRAPLSIAMAHYAARHGKKRWGEKTPHNIFYVDVIHDMFPAGKFIHLVRDPRAVVSSMNCSPYFAHDSAINALNWRHAIRSGVSYFNLIRTSKELLTIRYEDLVSHPETTTRTICEFVGEEFSSVMLEFHRTSDEEMSGNIRTRSITKPINPTNRIKWMSNLSSHDIRVIESICSAEMQELGYGRGTPKGTDSTWLYRKVREAYWHLQKFRHRHRRHFTVHHIPFLTSSHVIPARPASPCVGHE